MEYTNEESRSKKSAHWHTMSNSWNDMMDQNFYKWEKFDPVTILPDDPNKEAKEIRKAKHLTIINESIMKYKFNPDSVVVEYSKGFDENCGEILKDEEEGRLILIRITGSKQQNTIKVRALYNPEFGYWFEFNETNDPIYNAINHIFEAKIKKIKKELNSFINTFINKESLLEKINKELFNKEDFKYFKINQFLQPKWKFEDLRQEYEIFFKWYIRFFFDNVKGRYGYFYILKSATDLYSALCASFYNDENLKYSKDINNGNYEGVKKDDSNSETFTIIKKNKEGGKEKLNISYILQHSFIKDSGIEVAIEVYIVFNGSIFLAYAHIDDSGKIELKEEVEIIEKIHPNRLREDLENIGISNLLLNR